MNHLKYIDNFTNESSDSFEGYDAIEICENILSDKLKVNMCSHNSVSKSDNPLFEVKSYFKRCLEMLNNQLDTWKDNERMNKFITSIINNKTKIGEYNVLGTTCDGYYCWDCGDRLKPVLTSKNEISLISAIKFNDLSNGSSNKVNVSDIPECEAKGIKDMLTCNINVPSGKLSFTNMFEKDEINDMDNNDINDLLGRKKLMEYLSKKDIGYGQMSNMSVDVWKKLDGTEVLITEPYDKYENDLSYDGFENMGNISLSVCRWMCGDVKTLEKYNEFIPDMKVDTHKEEGYRDYILLDVKKGEWIIEHYFDIEEDREDKIYSKIYLK